MLIQIEGWETPGMDNESMEGRTVVPVTGRGKNWLLGYGAAKLGGRTVVSVTGRGENWLLGYGAGKLGGRTVFPVTGRGENWLFGYDAAKLGGSVPAFHRNLLSPLLIAGWQVSETSIHFCRATETSVDVYQTTQRHVQEGGSSYSHFCA